MNRHLRAFRETRDPWFLRGAVGHFAFLLECDRANLQRVLRWRVARVSREVLMGYAWYRLGSSFWWGSWLRERLTWR